MNKKVVLEFDAKTNKAVANVDSLNEAINDTKDSTNETNDSFELLGGTADNVTGGLVSGFKSGLKGARTLIGGMRTLKGAIASTGVGLLVVALGTLYTWMQTSEKGAKVLAKAEMFTQAFWKVLTDQLDDFISNDIGAFFEDPIAGIQNFGNMIKTYVYDQVMNIIDGLGLLGEAVLLLFDGEFAKAGEKAKEGALMYAEGVAAFFPPTAIMVAELNALNPLLEKAGEEMENAMHKAESLAEIQFMLVESTKAYTIASAELQQVIDLEQKIIDDTTRSYEERTEALDRQSEALEAKAKLDLQQAKLQESALRQEIAITANFEERKTKEQELAQAIADRIDKETQVTLVALDNAQKRREIDLEELERQKSITQQIEDLKTENIEDERKRIKTEMEIAQQRALEELELLKATEEEKQALKEQYAIATNKALAEYDAEAAKVKDDADKKKVEDEKKVADAKIQIEKQALGAITGLVDAFGGKNERAAERAFKVNQALGIAEAVVNTSRAVMAQLAVPQDALTGQNFVKAGIAAATGLAQVIKIKNTKFSGGSDTPDTNIGGGGGGGATPQIPQQPQVDFGFLQQGENQNTIQAYVLEQNVSSSQQANQLIQDQAVL